MKNSIKVVLSVLLLLGCSKENNTLDDIADYGGFISFTTTPELNFNILEFSML